MPELVHEHTTHVRTPEGLKYVPRTYGERRANGLWEAWLEFHPHDGRGPVLRTERETAQLSREAVEMWALGLSPVYFEGAFERASVVSVG